MDENRDIPEAMNENLCEFLLEYSDLPAAKRERTFMEIAGRSHLENPVSNVLAFYLDPSESHGMKGLIVSSLLSLIKSEMSAGKLEGSTADEFDILTEINLDSVTVFREDSTDEGKRIDIVVRSDQFVIGIEVKVNHSPDNDFCAYSKHLESLGDGRKPFKVLLGKEKISIGKKADGFTAISYSDLWEVVLAKMGSVALSCDPKWFFHLTDFIKQTKNFSSYNSSMNPEKLQFFERHSNRLGSLEEDMHVFKTHIIKRINNVRNVLDKEFRSGESVSVKRVDKGGWFTNTYFYSKNIFPDRRVVLTLWWSFQKSWNIHLTTHGSGSGEMDLLAQIAKWNTVDGVQHSSGNLSSLLPGIDTHSGNKRHFTTLETVEKDEKLTRIMADVERLILRTMTDLLVKEG